MITHAAMAAAPTIVYLPVSAQEGNTLSVISSEGSQAAKERYRSQRGCTAHCCVLHIYIYIRHCFMDEPKKDACYTKEHCTNMYTEVGKKFKDLKIHSLLKCVCFIFMFASLELLVNFVYPELPPVSGKSRPAIILQMHGYQRHLLGC